MLRFRAEAGHRYLAVSQPLAPRVATPAPSTLRARSNQADYLLIAPQAFLAAAEPLVARRADQGLTTRPVSFEEIASEFGAQCAVCAIDAKRRNPIEPDSGWTVYLHGGRTPTDLDAVRWAVRAAALGAGEILLTSMDRDGTGDGFDLELTRTVADAVGVPVIASGGVGTLDHLVDGIVAGHADAVLAASIFHYGRHTITDAKTMLTARGVTVRPVAAATVPSRDD